MNDCVIADNAIADYVGADRRHGREFVPADCYGLWCSLEDLSALCGYDPVKQFDLLRELPSVYPVVSGRDPYEIAEEHPMQALACVVSRFLSEYPEAADALISAAEHEVPEESHPVAAA